MEAIAPNQIFSLIFHISGTHKQISFNQTKNVTGGIFMTKKYNRGSGNQNSPKAGHAEAEFAAEFTSGDNSKGNKRNKGQQSKTNPHQ